MTKFIYFFRQYTFYNDCNILLKLYKHGLPFFLLDNAGILRTPGNKYITKGKSNDNPKLIIKSLINEFEYFYILHKTMKYNTKKIIKLKN